jgi:hypothetical protein
MVRTQGHVSGAGALGAARGLVVCLFFLSLNGVAAAGVGIAPARFELRSCALHRRGASIRAQNPLRLRGGEGEGDDAHFDGLPRESKVRIDVKKTNASRLQQIYVLHTHTHARTHTHTHTHTLKMSKF